MTPLTTENNQSEHADSEYMDSSPNTLEKLKPCLSLLERIINFYVVFIPQKKFIVVVSYEQDTDGQILYSSNTYSVGQVYDVAATFDGLSIKLYVNCSDPK